MDGEKKLASLTKTILIVEDDDDIGEFITLAIAQETAYRSMLVKDAFQALRRIRTGRPDLIILDYRLPGMNGIQFYERIRAHKELANIPVILISADIPESEVRKYHLILMPKPFDLDKLLNLVDRLISRPINIADYQTNDMKRA
jgi:DNA-binding response OmpR family regulator